MITYFFLFFKMIAYNTKSILKNQCHSPSKKKCQYFLSTRPNSNTSIYQTIKISIFAAPKRRKSEDLDLLPNPRKSLIFQAFLRHQLCTLVNRTTHSTCVDRVIEMHFPEFSLYSGSEKCCTPL